MKMENTNTQHLVAASILSVLVGVALQTGLGQHAKVTTGTYVKLSSGSVLKLDSLNIQSGGTGLFESGSAVNVFAALVNEGMMTWETGSTVHFVGGSQFLTGSTAFANVTKLGGGTLTFNSPITVNGTLQLDSGRIVIGSNDITIGPAGSIDGASSLGYIVTNNAGSLRRTVAASNVLFPVGPTSESYNPVTVNNAGTFDVFSVSVQTTFDNPPINPNGVVLRQWTINEDVPGASNATLVLQWNDTGEGSAFVRTNPISIGRYTGTRWDATPAVFADLGGNMFTATASGFDTFSKFALGGDIALPVRGELDIPTDFALHQNYPNPFNPSTVIRYALPERSNVKLEIYDVLGRQVAVLVNQEQEARFHEISWNASVSTGLYFYRISAVSVANRDRSFTQVKKMIVVK